jgi:tRNA modification GTPase
VFNKETIAAIATAPGESGIGIVKISGFDAVKISECFICLKNNEKISDRKSHSLFVAKIVDPYENYEVDEALVSIMKAPNTYTREDVVEINCHGNNIALKKTLQMALAAGARMAEPGEFTKRAFINGRIDLTQAEAVIDIIKSRSESGLKAAINQLEGRLSQKIEKIRNEIIEVLAQIEAAIDFSDEDIETIPKDSLIAILDNAKKDCEELLETAFRGKVLKDGLKTAIIGKPNVGKSSFLNTLIRSEKAIVTEIPGTTRDIIEEIINIRGIPIRLIDTAGLRETNDRVERLGVDLAYKTLNSADLILCVIDGSDNLTKEDIEIIEISKQKPAILVINKSDLDQNEFVSSLKLPKEFIGKVKISALEGLGIDKVEALIEKAVFAGNLNTPDALITNIRHENLIEKTLNLLKEADGSILLDQPEEVIAIALNEALNALGEITGKTATENILEAIFSRFCIGK